MTVAELTTFLNHVNDDREVKLLVNGQPVDIGAILFTGDATEITFVPAAPGGGLSWSDVTSTLS